MAQMVDLAITAGEIKSMLADVPDDTPVEFEPINGAWLGCSGALRMHKEGHPYDDNGRDAKLGDPGTHLVVYLYSDDK